MPQSPPTTPSRLPSRVNDDGSSTVKRPGFLSTRSLTPTTSLSYPKLGGPSGSTANAGLSGHRAGKPSISSVVTEASDADSFSVGGGVSEGAGLFAESSKATLEDGGTLGTGKEGNVGPSVHLSEQEGVEAGDDDDGAGSDDSDVPPHWMAPRDRKGKGKASAATEVDQLVEAQLAPPASVEPQIKSPVFLKQIGASQSLLQEQLRKGEAQAARLRDETVPATERKARRPPAQPPDARSTTVNPPTDTASVLTSSTTTRTGTPVPPPPLSKRKYFILSSAGKPVWSTEEDGETDVTGQAGVMQAIVSIFADEGDKLRYIDAGPVRIAALLKPPLYFFVVSDWGEPESVLSLHLEYLHLLVLSIVSLTQLNRLFERRLNYDLRRSLHGTESFFSGLVDRLASDFSILTGSLDVFQCDKAVRDEVGTAVTPSVEQSKDLLYAIVLAYGKVVTLVRPKRHSVHPSDLHILISTILSSSSLRTSESWLPVCLPRYNATGFLHAYVSFPAPSLGLVFVSGDREGFFALREWGESITETLKASSEAWTALTGESVTDAGNTEADAEGPKYSLGDLAVPGLRHFLYKHRAYVQVTMPAWEDDYLDEANRRRLVTLYQRCHDLMHGRAAEDRAPAKLVYLRNEHEAVLGWTTSKYELYMALSPLLSKSAAMSAAQTVAKWVKAEDHRLFLISAPAF